MRSFLFMNELAEAILSLKTKEDMVDFLQGILTPKELEEIATRLRIVKLLKKGVAQHAIAAKLGVGVATVTRGSKEIKNNRFEYINT